MQPVPVEYKNIPSPDEAHTWYHDKVLQAYLENDREQRDYLISDIRVLISLGTIEQDKDICRHITVLKKIIRGKCEEIQRNTQ